MTRILVTRVMDNLNSSKWKYKHPLKNCLDCKNLNFVTEEGNKKMFCKLYHETFLGKCPSKIVIRKGR